MDNHLNKIMVKKLLKICLVAALVLSGLISQQMVATAQAPGEAPENTRQVTPGKSCDPGNGALPTALFVPWYYYLEGQTTNGKCSPKLPTKGGGTDYVKGVSLVALAVIDTLIRLSSLIAVGFLIYGSVQYITSQGEPQGLAAAKTTISNAIIGLVIVMMAVAVVQFIGNSVR